MSLIKAFKRIKKDLKLLKTWLKEAFQNHPYVFLTIIAGFLFITIHDGLIYQKESSATNKIEAATPISNNELLDALYLNDVSKIEHINLFTKNYLYIKHKNNKNSVISLFETKDYKSVSSKYHYDIRPEDEGKLYVEQLTIGEYMDAKIKKHKIPQEYISVDGTYFYEPVGIIIGIIFIFVIIIVIVTQMTNKQNKGIGMVLNTNNNVTFEDVAGQDDAKEELLEIIDFLKFPDKYKAHNIQTMKGIILAGPPGIGKTLMAKAVANEAKVNFIPCSGSDFVEMYVGVGAARVRKIFEEARKNSPCIIFIDEIDALGARGNDQNSERDQTLNQILVEMDGVGSTQGVIVMAATNFIENLDKALLRPGRFDRKIYMTLPDLNSREQIFNVHLKEKLIDSNASSEKLAKISAGFSGADIAQMVNEAALISLRKNQPSILMNDFEDAKDKVMLGSLGNKKTRVLTEDERKIIAYHEAGHTVLTKLLNTSPLYKVSIIPTGNALGVTISENEQEVVLHEKNQLLNEISVLLAGRLAEKIFLNKETTGASNDFLRATEIAKKMVTEWGMSKLGFLSFSRQGHPTAQLFNKEHITEINCIIQEQKERTEAILTKEQVLVEKIALALLEKEVLNKEDLQDLFETI